MVWYAYIVGMKLNPLTQPSSCTKEFSPQRQREALREHI